ncbi:MAG: L,D-transpeptidase family protein [Paracoccaceae bacterium]|nr:L,D-transpeptidase family protein [Paracoccaceae bacterium]
MINRRFLILALPLVAAACGRTPSKFLVYRGPQVTRVLVFKEARRMHLMHFDRALASFEIDLGFAPVGHKNFEGDGRTPEGEYLIDRRNPNSRFHLSLGISYPNEEDIARALAAGKKPGGDIFIHGRPRLYQNGQRDWTWGCIAVTDAEMEVIYSMVQDGTPISIFP